LALAKPGARINTTAIHSQTRDRRGVVKRQPTGFQTARCARTLTMFDNGQRPSPLSDEILSLATALKQLAMRAHAAGDMRAGLVLANLALLLETALSDLREQPLAA
jgi:hypothetical protein